MGQLEDLQAALSNTVAGYESEREEAANREFQIVKSLRERIDSLKSDWDAREHDLIDIITECRDALAAVVDDVEKHRETPQPEMRTTMARATDLLRNKGLE